MESHLHDPLVIKAEDIDPHHDWSRALRSPGAMNVDFEELINFRRLHRYRRQPVLAGQPRQTSCRHPE